MSDPCPPSLTVASDGFLWYDGAKLPCKLVPGGLEFYEKDPRRAQLRGGALYIVPFAALVNLVTKSAGIIFNATIIEVEIKDS
jgi:hypothetical protein